MTENNKTSNMNTAQGPSNLRPLKSFITTHNSDGKAVALERPASWDAPDKYLGFNVVYTTSTFPPDLNDEKDIRRHDEIMAGGKLGLVNPGGTVWRIVDFSPKNTPLMHRTQSLDLGVVLEGSVEMHLDSGEVHILNRGDVAVQRATQHAWKNRSDTEWARMLFVLQDSAPLMINGEHYKEDLSNGDGSIPSSGND